MARRRRLIAPDQSELEKLDEGFAAKPPLGQSMTPPIAQIASEAAALAGMSNVTDRVQVAKDAADAGKYREADADGRIALAIPISEIDEDLLRRDRIADDPEDRVALLQSIRDSGLRSPIEVMPMEDGYGLISGFRRLWAFRQLAEQDPEFQTIPAFVRTHDERADAYLSMVEENEIRANLSHYERGRIATLTSQQGVFPTVDDAVNALFAQASKSKRSKVRSFALVHEALGDLLTFPRALTEKSGLRLAAALRGGRQGVLRGALDGLDALTPEHEWKALERVLKRIETGERDTSRGGRPSEVIRMPARALTGGGELTAQVSEMGLTIQLRGRPANEEMATLILDQIEDLLK